MPLGSGDVLMVVSDGVLEAGVDRGEEFGEDRLIEAIKASIGDVDKLLDGLLDEVLRFSPGAQSDDVTVVAVKGV